MSEIPLPPTTTAVPPLPEASQPLPSGNTPNSFLQSVVGDNPYLSAGLGLMGVGVFLRGGSQAAVLGLNALRRRMLVSLEINNKDPAYEWFLMWMAHRQTQAQPSGVVARWTRSTKLSAETTLVKRANGSSSVTFSLVAGPGVHYFNYRGAWLQIKRERETRAAQLVSQSASVPWETVTLTTLSRDRNLFPGLLTEARDLAMRGKDGKLVLYSPDSTEWKQLGQPRRKRPLQSVVLGDGVSEKIESDIKEFMNRRDWYADRGIPYRRGYLLHGPPGSGKSSFIQALAGSLSYDICVLSMSGRGLTDDRLTSLLSNTRERSFVLIEDIDAAFNKRVQTSADGYQSGVTFSGFLNALDGVASGEERIVFMTTNHPERLDPALIRPGRVDLAMLIDDATPSQARRLFTRFYADADKSLLAEYTDQLKALLQTEMDKGRRISMAALQGLFIRNSVDKAIPACVEFFKVKMDENV